MKVNLYRQAVNRFAKQHRICTQCFSAPADEERVQCRACIDRNFNKRAKRTGSAQRSIIKRGIV